MLPSNQDALRTTYDQYGPGTDRDDIAAGYAAAIGAVLAAALYIFSVWLVDSGHLGLDWSPYFAALEFHWVVYFSTVGSVIAAPTAFLIGVAGWRAIQTQTAFSGALRGVVGAVATYVAAFVPIAAMFFVTGAGSAAAGSALANALELAGIVVAVGFALTWWLTIPVGCLVGVVYTVNSSTTA
ncbi:hypothetical protein [Natronobacterium texcoconense]|uniref:Yip1 domain-containing protein n=1 Tax=Natronobacterium texcoconense TaxID=1095778 RepID=A0A1H1IWY8_NATTX|nr:hypothetical protein [Natronobacterium texcoconense]SDR42222.1 hypothetical protein SAMN04489842_3873 [Natronobacterium texcoconense]